jgi:hypothetical protein
MKTQTILLISLALLLSAGLLLAFSMPRKELDGPGDQVPVEKPGGLDCDKLLFKQTNNFTRQPEVEALQRWLNSQLPTPMALLRVDGKFGTLTEGALQVVTGKKRISLRELNRDPTNDSHLFFSCN